MQELIIQLCACERVFDLYAEGPEYKSVKRCQPLFRKKIETTYNGVTVTSPKWDLVINNEQLI